MNIIIKEEIGNNPVGYAHAQLLLDKLSFIKDDKYVLSSNNFILDFNGVGVISSPFFNGSIGILLKDLPIEEILRKVKIINMPDYAKYILNTVIKNALEYYNE